MPMHGTAHIVTRDARGVAGPLGWLSIALGLAGLLAPRRTARLVGAPTTRPAVIALRVVGLRELACGLGIVARPRAAGWLWARVAGDLMDLALLTSALAARHARPGRVTIAAAGVMGIAALDVRAARALGGAGGTAVRRTITIGRPAEELYRFWRDVTNLPRFMQRLESVEPLGDRRTRWRARGPGGTAVQWEAEIVDDRPGALIAWRSLPGSQLEHAGVVRFERVPGERGTQVTVELQYTPPGGVLGAAVARVLGRAPEQELQEDLRRLKQIVETGDVVVSAGQRGVAQPSDDRRPALRAVATGGRP